MTYLPRHFPFSIWKNFERYEVLTAVLPKVQVRFKWSGIRRGVKLFIHTYVSGAENFSKTSMSHKTVTFTQELICLGIHYSSPRSHQDVFDPNLPNSLRILCFRDKCNPIHPSMSLPPAFQALTSLIKRLRSSLYSALLLYPLIPSSCNASLWTTSAHLDFGLPTGLVV